MIAAREVGPDFAETWVPRHKAVALAHQIHLIGFGSPLKILGVIVNSFLNKKRYPKGVLSMSYFYPQ